MRVNLRFGRNSSGPSNRSLLAIALLSSFLIGVAALLTVKSTLAAPAANPSSAPACAPNWNIVASPNPLSNNYLYGISAVSANDVWAVGRYYQYNNGTAGGTLTEHWDGAQWTQIPGANAAPDRQGQFNAVAAVSSNDVWAVGMYYPGTAGQNLIEHWDGTQWTIVPSPNRPGYNELLGVTAISSNDVWAVGYTPGNHATLTMHWNGSFWAIVPSPPESFGNDYILTSVSAVSTNDVWAVGYQDRGSGSTSALIEHWDGAQWTIVPSPNPGTYYGSLYGVTAISSNDVWAVGAYSNDGGSTHPTLMMHWNGAQWSAVPGNSPNVFNSLRSVSAAGPNDVWAVGLTTDCNLCLTFETLIEHWDGAQWSVVSSPNGNNNFNRLRGVTAVSSSDVWTVGYSDQYNYPYLSDTLIERHTCLPTPTVTGTPPTATRTATALPSATPTTCSLANTNYVITQSAGATVVPATIDTGLHCDECVTTITLPFQFSLYGQAFSQVVAGSNGTLGFVSNSNTWRTACMPSQEFDYAILPYWQDLHLSNQGGGCPNCGIFISTEGAAPNRIFNIEWRARDYFYTSPVNVEVRLYESSTSGQFDVIYSSVPSGTNQQVTVGVQKGRGDLYTQFVCENQAPMLSNGNKLVFSQPGCNSTATPTRTVIGTATRTRTVVAGSPTANATNTREVNPTQTITATVAASATASMTANATTTATATATVCVIAFTDVPVGSTFYANIECLACKGVISGYNDGTFKPDNLVTRGQLAKIVSNAGSFTETPGAQIFEDVPSTQPFYDFINRLTNRGIMSGYTCGSPGEPCGSGNKPYFRPYANATRGQTSKIVANASHYAETPTEQTFEDVPSTHPFYEWIQRLASRGIMGGYNCGSPGEPCGTGNKPYFRPFNNVTRGQSAKILGNAFFPDCNR